MIPGTSKELDATLAFVAGDIWTGLGSSTITPAPDANVELIEFYVRDTPVATTNRLKLDSDTDIADQPGTKQIVIDDATTWTFHIPRQNISLGPGTYYWQMKFTKTGESRPLTYMAGTLNVSTFRPTA